MCVASVTQPDTFKDPQCRFTSTNAPACHRRTEKIQKFSDPELTVCPHCGGPLERTITAAAISFKGGGWYKDGYASAKPAASSEGSGGDGSGSGSDGANASGGSATGDTGQAARSIPSRRPRAPARERSPVRARSRRTAPSRLQQARAGVSEQRQRIKPHAGR